MKATACRIPAKQLRFASGQNPLPQKTSLVASDSNKGPIAWLCAGDPICYFKGMPVALLALLLLLAAPSAEAQVFQGRPLVEA